MRLKIDYDAEIALKGTQDERISTQTETITNIKTVLENLDTTWQGTAAETFKSRFDILANHFNYLLEMYESCEGDVTTYKGDMTEADSSLGGKS